MKTVKLKSNKSIGTLAALMMMTTFLCLSCKKNKVSTAETSKTTPRNVTLAPFEIGAYLPYWGLATYQNYDYSNINTLYMLATISQASVQNDRGLIWGDDDSSPTAYNGPSTSLDRMLTDIRAANPNIKIILALSDLHNTDQQRAATATLFNATNRAQTINWIMDDYVDVFGFDGVDIDFEDASLDAGYIGDNYPLFIRDLADSLHNSTARGKRKLCTATLAIGDYVRTNINSNVYNNVDLLGIQDYGREKMDYRLAEPGRNLAQVSANWATKVAKSKLSFGLGLWSQYAATASGTGVGDGISFGELLKLNPSDTTFTPYLTTYFNAPGKPSGYVQRYNSLYESRRKAEYVKANGFKGMFAWDISKDANDAIYKKYSQLKMLKSWNTNAANYPKIVAYTQQDYYSSTQAIVGGFHSLPATGNRWVGIYELKTGTSIGYFQNLTAAASGSFTIPAATTQTLTANKLYILRFFSGTNGIGQTQLGTSNPFYRQ